MKKIKGSDTMCVIIYLPINTKISETVRQLPLRMTKGKFFELLKAGLLQDENGKLSNRMRIKALELLGFGIWENAQDINELHTKKASKVSVLLYPSSKIKLKK